MKVYPRVRRVFLRNGDGASSFDLKSIVLPPLSDGTKIQINLSYNSWKNGKKWDDRKTFKWKLEPIKREWYVSISVRDDRRFGSRYFINDWALMKSSAQVRQVIRRVFAGKNRLLGVWMKHRKSIIAKWLKES